jgi:anthranilate phosphoribosyltransferase
MMIEELLSTVHQGADLTADQMQQAILRMLAGELPDEAIGELLLGLRRKGESVSELVGAARAMRKMMSPIRTARSGLLDTCGTGGDGAKTFNISTAAAIVAAAAGANVAKHGNRKITSATGSADVLSELGVKIDADRRIVERCLDELGICFCFAPLLHPAMKHVAQVRRSLGVPTLFNYLGPLCNPASAAFQIIGVGKEDLQSKIASTLAQLPIEAAIVVRGADGLDEVTLTCETNVVHVQHQKLSQLTWTPESFGLPTIRIDDIAVEDAAESAATIRRILDGKKGPARDIVLANSGAALWVSGVADSLQAAVSKASISIDSGGAKALLKELGTMSNESSEETSS